MRLLIVEDEEGLASALKVGLTREGYAVDVALTSAEARDKLAFAEYDVALLDVNLPDGDGFALAQGIRDSSVDCLTGTDLRIVMLTARGKLLDRVRGLDVGRRRLPRQAVRTGRAHRSTAGGAAAGDQRFLLGPHPRLGTPGRCATPGPPRRARAQADPEGVRRAALPAEPAGPSHLVRGAARTRMFVPETLVPACEELESAFREAWADAAFRGEYDAILRDYAGRPSLLSECHNLGGRLGLRLLLKREDLNHTGSHKINNVLGQALLAKRMGKPRFIAETGAGQHGVATATAAALMGLQCKVYMGAVDVARQELNVFRMRLLGAEVEAVDSGSRTLKDAVNEALRDWVASVESSYYCIGSVMGPHPYPWMVRELHRVIGDEARTQCKELLGDDPDVVVACVGGGSNAIGLFSGFVDTDTRLVGAEPAGGAAVGRGVPGVVHGMRSYLMQDEYGQVEEAQSISAGLDYPGVGPEHSYLHAIGRAEYPSVSDDEVLDAFTLLARTEGIIAAFESAHAIAWVIREAASLAGQTVLVNLSGRGDKDVAQAMELLG